MLNQLMAVKRRREQGARQRIAKLVVQLKEHEQQKAQLLAQQVALREAWRAHNAAERQVSEHEMRNVQKEFNDFFTQDAQAVQQLAQLQASLTELETREGALRQQLAEARIDQEKLAYLLEQKQ